MMKRVCAAFVSVVLLAACGGSSSPPATTPGGTGGPAKVVASDAHTYRATVRWTEHGVPHIEASDLGGLAFGQGYAFASLHLCVLAEQIVKIKGERARHFGPGDDDSNIDSDFGQRGLGLYRDAKQDWAAASAEAKALVAGYVAGYNHYLGKTPAAQRPAACRGAVWVRPLTHLDLVAYGRSVAMMASGAAFAKAVGSAKPHRGKAAAKYDLPGALGLASNGWAIGRDLSATGGGIVVANPHFPWEGPRKFYEVHLTIPGDFDVYGANLMGLPLISIGFTATHGWTHTFSAARRFALYRLKLDPQDPTSYMYGTERRRMTKRDHTIGVKQSDGVVRNVTRSLYSTHFGPMVDGKLLRWNANTGVGYALYDAARDNIRSTDQYLAMIRAKTPEAFKKAFSDYQSTPFVNTMYAHRDGQTWFIDGSRVPHISAKAMGMWNLGLRMIPALKKAYDMGLVVLDGSNPVFEPAQDAGAVTRGIVGFASAPKLARTDYVFNANDTYWVPNAKAPLPAASPFFGRRETPLSARSRMNLKNLGETGSDGKLDVKEIEALILSNRGFLAEEWKDAVAKRCLTLLITPQATKAAKYRAKASAHLRAPCEVLAKWDGRADLDSKGAVLWREFVTAVGKRIMSRHQLFAVGFDAKNPATTPAGFAPLTDGSASWLLSDLDRAVRNLRNARVDPTSATLRQLQFTEVSGKRVPVSGGLQREGILNKTLYRSARETMLPTTSRRKVINERSGLTERGYPVNDGSSFIMIVRWTKDGPDARGLMTYGASSDPSSPLAAEQFRLWERKQLRPMLFSRKQIDASPKLRVEQLSGAKKRARNPMQRQDKVKLH